MSQSVQRVCEALCDVLNHASHGDSVSLAGYAKNLDFWVDEIKHRLLVIDGLLERRRRAADGMKEAIGDPDKELPVVSTPERLRQMTVNSDEIERQTQDLRQRILTASRRLFRSLREAHVIDDDSLFSGEDGLGERLQGR